MTATNKTPPHRHRRKNPPNQPQPPTFRLLLLSIMLLSGIIHTSARYPAQVHNFHYFPLFFGCSLRMTSQRNEPLSATRDRREKNRGKLGEGVGVVGR